MKKILLWGVIIGFLTLPYAHALGSITGADWNGKYWLLATAEGDVVRYDGEKFSYLANLGCTPMEMKWAGGYWLMGCRKVESGEYPDKALDRLIIYDGEGFRNISTGYAPQKIACNREYCLMFGGARDERLMKYDGAKLVDITPGLRMVSSTPWINEMKWAGDYWLITTTQDLVRYDGDSFTIDTRGLSVSALGWNGDYWLVVSTEKQDPAVGYKPRLLKYDGEALTEITLPPFFDKTELKQQGKGYLIPRKVVWSGEYWLMSTDFPVLVRYDGDAFTEISLPIRDNGVSDIAWNGEYWLVSYPASPGNLRIIKYDGAGFTELTDMPEYAMLTIFGWTGEYWLIGTAYSSPFGILKYDGDAFIDLTGEFTKAGQGMPPSPPPSQPAWHPMTLFALLLLLTAGLALLWRTGRIGALLGAVWGAVGPILYWALADTTLPWMKTLVKILALPMLVYSEIIPEDVPGGSIYYSPLIALPFSIALGALIGYAAWKLYDKVK
jgi:hypothetical protein